VNYIRLFVFNKGLSSENTLCGTNLFRKKASYRVLETGAVSDHLFSVNIGGYILMWKTL
jgi:hypothetical protein